jgi:hypothetical protein
MPEQLKLDFEQKAERVYPEVPEGYCACGCGQKTKISDKTSRYHGFVKGKPRQFVTGHNQYKQTYFEGVLIPPHSYTEGNRRIQARWFRIYRHMIGRCYDPSEAGYPNYGGRGIEVCLRWRQSASAFYKDMGPPPEDMVLDRRDNNKGYSPSNCRWVTQAESGHNRRNNKFTWELVKEIRSLRGKLKRREIAKKLGLPPHMIDDILYDHCWKEIPSVPRA